MMQMFMTWMVVRCVNRKDIFMSNRATDIVVIPKLSSYPEAQQHDIVLTGYTEDGTFVGSCTILAERTTRAVFVKDYRYILTYNSYYVDNLEICRTILHCDMRPSEIISRVPPIFSNSIHALKVYRKHQIIVFNRYFKENAAE